MEEENEIKSSDTVQRNCPGCGGILSYSPEKQMLVCEYCGATVGLDMTPAKVEEHDFKEWCAHPEMLEKAETLVAEVVCGQCGAHTTFPENTTSYTCAFCGSPIVLKQDVQRRSWKAEYILPFKIGKTTTNQRFRSWASSLWFAPSDFTKKMTADERMKGVYLPYWTYDADTTTEFRGRRGVAREVSRTVNGRRQSHTVIDWYPVSGTVRHSFDDILVPASSSMPSDISKVLTNWDKKNYVAYKDQFVRGFLTELYQYDFKVCYPTAKKTMETYISNLIRTEIGGSQQQILQHNTTYSNVKFKHILLPVWLSAYRYKGKPYVFAINGRTGQVFGQRPWSIPKIAAFVIMIIIALIMLFKYFS